MMTLFVDDLSAFVLSHRKRDQKLLTSQLHWVMLSNGDADFHDNVIFFGFNEKQHQPVLVAKVPRLIENGWMLRREYDGLVELWNCIGEDAIDYVPKPFAMTTLQERPVLMISYVAGESLALTRRSFWSESEQVAALASDAARSLRRLNDLTERPIENGEVPGSDFPQKAEKFRQLFQLTSGEEKILSALVKAREHKLARARHQVLIQGDFWHGNMIHDQKRGKLMFVDWQFACWSADVSMDVYFFLLAAALSASENGAVEPRAKEAFELLKTWSTHVIPGYLSSYGKPEGYDLLPQRDGMLLCCVEKAVRSALDFGYSDSDDLLWRYLFAEVTNWPDEE